MKPIEEHEESESWTSEGWTGEQDAVSAIALGVCLVLAALIFTVLAVVELTP